jgi:ABC-type branched-subunit amino acid transport system substrate-binding protein
VLFNSDDDAGKFGNIQYQALWGKQIVASANVPTQGVTDFTQYVNTVKSKNPDLVVVSTDFATAIKLKAGIIQSGYKGLVMDYTTYIPGLLDASKDTAAALEGGYSNTQIPATEDGGEGTKQAIADLQAIGKPAFLAFGAAVSYWSTDLMIDLYKQTAAKGDVTADNFRKVTEAGVTYKGVPGGIGTIKYPEGHTVMAPCAGLVQVKGGKYVTSVPFQCYPTITPPAK